MMQWNMIIWWIDPGWTPGTHQATQLIYLLNWRGEKSTKKGSWVKIWAGRSLTNYHHGQSPLWVINLLPVRIRVGL